MAGLNFRIGAISHSHDIKYGQLWKNRFMNILNKLLLNENDAAELLSMSIHFLRRDRISEHSVGIPFIRIGGAIRYPRARLEEWVMAELKKMSLPSIPVVVIPSPSPIEKRRPGRPKKCARVAEMCDAIQGRFLEI